MVAVSSTIAPSAEMMIELGTKLGKILRVGDAVALQGALGAGKTTFVQGLARGLGVEASRHVASPTFALVNEHPGRVPLVHADLYRIKDEAELRELGLEDACQRAVLAIEWADRFPALMPRDHLWIAIASLAGGAREVTFRSAGLRAQDICKALNILM